MITLEEIKEKQEELNKMIDEYNKKDFNWNKNWKPDKSDTYFYIDEFGDVKKFSCDNEILLEKHIKSNRIFQTEEQTEKWLEIDTYLKSKSFDPDWENENEKKYYIIYNYFTSTFWSLHDYYSFNFSKYYFKSEEIVKEIFKKYSKKELEFYFNI